MGEAKDKAAREAEERKNLVALLAVEADEVMAAARGIAGRHVDAVNGACSATVAFEAATRVLAALLVRESIENLGALIEDLPQNNLDALTRLAAAAGGAPDLSLVKKG